MKIECVVHEVVVGLEEVDGSEPLVHPCASKSTPCKDHTVKCTAMGRAPYCILPISQTVDTAGWLAIMEYNICWPSIELPYDRSSLLDTAMTRAGLCLLLKAAESATYRWSQGLPRSRIGSSVSAGAPCSCRSKAAVY